ncbi:MAG: protein kinase [Proteobacteria bacterium]|nr:protein kinase [Pseudomonadota bacterium]
MKRHRTADLEPTDFGGRYKLVRRLAVGGMAEIYLARQAAMDGFEKEVVIKRLRAELADDPRIVEMFLDEARIGALLNHPNIVHVYDVDEHDGIPYIAMEYIVGEELNELCRRGIQHDRFLPLEHAVELMRQAAAGMGYFHSKRGAEGTVLQDQALEIVHFDISPSNLLVTQDGFLKIIDFGIARALGQARRGETLPGKLSYMSPEQAAPRREPGTSGASSTSTIDHRSDIFSLGIVLYEITVGRRLFRGTATEVVQRLTEAQVEPPTFIRRNFPPALEAIVMRALEKHPADRYQSAYDLADDLETFLRDERLHSGPVRIARYLDMLTHKSGGTRRVELVSEAEARAAAGGEELDFDQFQETFAPTEGAPGPAQSPEWEDAEQPEADVAKALGMELDELRLMRTPVPMRPSGMALMSGREPARPVADDADDPTNPKQEAVAPKPRPVTVEEGGGDDHDGDAGVTADEPIDAPEPDDSVPTLSMPALSRRAAPSNLTPVPLADPRAITRDSSPIRDSLPTVPFASPIVSSPIGGAITARAAAATSRLPWMIAGGLGLLVVALLVYIARG